MQNKNEVFLGINERIFQFIDYLKITKYKFSKETGISESVLLNLSKNINKPSLGVFEKILQKYQVNINWLISGEGNMLLNNENICCNCAKLKKLEDENKELFAKCEGYRTKNEICQERLATMQWEGLNSSKKAI